MAQWVALLRGVNVGGVRVAMEPLRGALREAGFEDVATVLASGNVVLRGAGRREAVKRRIEALLSERFGYEAWIVLLKPDRLRDAVAGFPFEEDADSQPNVIFASDETVLPALAGFAEAAADDDEHVQAGDGVLYWRVPRGRSVHTPFAKELAKRAYKSTTTTRNLRTLRKILALTDDGAAG